MHFQVLVYDGYHEADVLLPLAVLQRAAVRGAEFRAELVRLGSGTVTSAHGLGLHVRTPLAAAYPPDVLVVPGAPWLITDPGDEWAAGERSKLAAVIATLAGENATVAAVDSGALILASAGLLRGQPSVSDPRVPTELRSGGAELVDACVVDAGAVITSSGITAGVDLALWLVERYSSAHRARELENELRYQRGTVWVRPG
jgi:transcriptional regulator GlxA family with amidase domain